MKEPFNDSSSEELPTIFEVWRALQMLSQHAHIKVHFEKNDRDRDENSINVQLFNVADTVVPFENENDPTKFQWNGDLYDETSNVLDTVIPQLKDRYSDFPLVVSALSLVKKAAGNIGWKNLVEETYTPKSIETSRECLFSNYFDCPSKIEISVPHSSYDNTERGQKLRSLAVPVSEK